MKTCKRCGLTLPLTDFYTHSRMADGYLSFCKQCTKNRIKKERRLHPEKHSERERRRYTGARKEKMIEAARMRNAAGGPKYIAHNAVNNAVRDGKLEKPDCCSKCGRTGVRIEGHHDDYSKPLDVIWFCARCHKRHHADNPAIPT